MISYKSKPLKIKITSVIFFILLLFGCKKADPPISGSMSIPIFPDKDFSGYFTFAIRETYDHGTVTIDSLVAAGFAFNQVYGDTVYIGKITVNNNPLKYGPKATYRGTYYVNKQDSAFIHSSGDSANHVGGFDCFYKPKYPYYPTFDGLPDTCWKSKGLRFSTGDFSSISNNALFVYIFPDDSTEYLPFLHPATRSSREFYFPPDELYALKVGRKFRLACLVEEFKRVKIGKAEITLSTQIIHRKRIFLKD